MCRREHTKTVNEFHDRRKIEYVLTATYEGKNIFFLLDVLILLARVILLSQEVLTSTVSTV